MEKISIAYKLLFFIVAVLLCICAIVFANERIIFSDTSGYLIDMINRGNYIVPTNRFVAVLSQILPLLGISLDLPLSTLVVLYSLNFMLIPVVCSVLCLVWLKQWKVAVSIMLLYTLMSIRLFYYPVSEFQIGLCLLLFYHAFFIHTLQLEDLKKRFSQLIQVLLIVTITFSHPLSFIAFVVWGVWLLITLKENKQVLVFPAATAVLAFLGKELFFKATLNGQAFDEQRAEGIKNFILIFPDYFQGNLLRSFIHVLTGDYFMLLVLLVLFLFLLLKERKILQAVFLAGVFLGFVLLVSVSFYTKSYDYYYEHLLQPLPFFIALAFCTIDLKLARQRIWKFSLLVGVFAISLVKMYNGHETREKRFAWYQHYFALMQQLQIQKASLARDYISIDERGSYWSSTSESLLLSALDGADSSKTLLLVWDYNSLQEDIENPEIVAYDGSVAPVRIFNRKYFRLNKTSPYVILDSVVAPKLLMELSKVD